jgi:hypothetical protein
MLVMTVITTTTDPSAYLGAGPIEPARWNSLSRARVGLPNRIRLIRFLFAHSPCGAWGLRGGPAQAHPALKGA